MANRRRRGHRAGGIQPTERRSSKRDQIAWKKPLRDGSIVPCVPSETSPALHQLARRLVCPGADQRVSTTTYSCTSDCLESSRIACSSAPCPHVMHRRAADKSSSPSATQSVATLLLSAWAARDASAPPPSNDIRRYRTSARGLASLLAHGSFASYTTAAVTRHKTHRPRPSTEDSAYIEPSASRDPCWSLSPSLLPHSPTGEPLPHSSSTILIEVY